MSIVKNHTEIEEGVWYRVQHHPHEDCTYFKLDGHAPEQDGIWLSIRGAFVIHNYADGRLGRAERRDFGLLTYELEDNRVTRVVDAVRINKLEKKVGNPD